MLASLIEQAKSTRVLHLSYMGLERVPAQVWTLTDLIRLDLGHNDIRELHPDIGKLTALEELWLNSNPLSGVPESIHNCKALMFVNFQETEIVSLPAEMCRLPRLTDLSLSQKTLKPKLANAYNAGTRRLMEYLARKDEKRDLKQQLTQRFRIDMYREHATTARGAAAIDTLVSAVFKEFTSFEDVRLVIRNIERLFSADLFAADATAARARLTALQRENEVKKLGADLELKLRAIYFDVIRPESVEGIIKSIYESITVLEDVRFLLHFAKDLFPKDPREIDGKRLLIALQELRAKRKAERDAAVQGLARALAGMYTDKDTEDVGKLAAAVAKLFKSVDDIKSLTADAATYFPGEFTSVRPSKVLRQFTAAQEAKKAP